VLAARVVPFVVRRFGPQPHLERAATRPCTPPTHTGETAEEKQPLSPVAFAASIILLRCRRAMLCLAQCTASTCRGRLLHFNHRAAGAACVHTMWYNAAMPVPLFCARRSIHGQPRVRGGAAAQDRCGHANPS
jgi:hypothetical protein